MGHVVRTTPATHPAVSLVDAKQHLRVTDDESDALIEAYIEAAVEYAESFTRRAFMPAVFTLTLPEGFPRNGDRGIDLPRSPLVSVDECRYIDPDGTQQTLAGLVADTAPIVGRAMLAYGASWPSTRAQIHNPVEIDFTAGYSAASAQEAEQQAAIPRTIRQAILLMVGHFFENREEVVVGTIAARLPLAVRSLLYSQRVVELR